VRIPVQLPGLRDSSFQCGIIRSAVRRREWRDGQRFLWHRHSCLCAFALRRNETPGGLNNFRALLLSVTQRLLHEFESVGLDRRRIAETIEPLHARLSAKPCNLPFGVAPRRLLDRASRIVK
jgi:hypothetical protein